MNGKPSSDISDGKCRGQIPVGIRGVEDVIRKFPAYGANTNGQDNTYGRDLECADCHAVFFTPEECDQHRQSSSCPASAAVAFVIIRDPSQTGGYLIERRLLPFDVAHSFIKCCKCDESFPTQAEVDVHQSGHTSEDLECGHCQKLFETPTELESHYEWHDDMEYRHHRNRLRAKQPGLKLQSELGPKDQSDFVTPSFKRRIVPGQSKAMPIIYEATITPKNDSCKFRLRTPS